ncbi:MAG: rhomboid family intramembrane serine protease [Flavobacteriales bacterium]|nr:rhomboid family intramembrane serine protease [Flavobacteriales bacterium]|tara:strand:- start:25836 stop:26708 length:873 start_codon:yes stop_codon:yes gene_type:complete
MNTIWNDIKRNYKSGTTFTRILYINIGFFILYKLLFVFSFLFDTGEIDTFIKDYLSLPSNTILLLKKPWTFISYMFVHQSFFHLLFNMVWLHLGSKLFLEYFNGKQLISTYILGGISGGLLFITAFNVLPVFSSNVLNSYVFGASASVIAVFVTISTYSPNYRISIPLIGNIPLKYIAITLITIDILSISPDNPGGHIAHIGGAIYGYIYVSLLKTGIDISVNFYNFINFFSQKKKKKSKKVNTRKSDDIFRSEKAEKQKHINSILEKISKSGYDSLTKEEKELLFKESK